MNEKLVRQAIAYAMDYDGIVNDIFGGYAEKADSFISSTIWGYKAVDGVGVYPKTKEYDEYIAACFSAVGIQCTVVPMDTSAGGDILLGKKPKRQSEEEIVIYSVGGMPVEDVAWGKICYENAVKKGIGTKLHLWDQPYMW